MIVSSCDCDWFNANGFGNDLLHPLFVANMISCPKVEQN